MVKIRSCIWELATYFAALIVRFKRQFSTFTFTQRLFEMKTFLELDSRIFWLLIAAGASIMAIAGCEPPAQSGFETEDETDAAVVVRPNSLNITAIGVPEFQF